MRCSAGASARFDAHGDAAICAALDWVLRHQPGTLVFTVLTLVATIWLYVVIPKGFLPQQDTGLLVGVTDAAQDISFATMAERQRALAELIARDPDVVAVDSFVGAGTVNPTLNSGRLYIDIGSPDHRASSAAAIMERLHRAASSACPASRCICSRCRTSRSRPAPRARSTSTSCRISTRRAAALDASGCSMRCARQPELADVASDQQDEGLQMMVTIDRAAAARSASP